MSTALPRDAVDKGQPPPTDESSPRSVLPAPPPDAGSPTARRAGLRQVRTRPPPPLPHYTAGNYYDSSTAQPYAASPAYSGGGGGALFVGAAPMAAPPHPQAPYFYTPDGCFIPLSPHTVSPHLSEGQGGAYYVDYGGGWRGEGTNGEFAIRQESCAPSPAPPSIPRHPQLCACAVAGLRGRDEGG